MQPQTQQFKDATVNQKQQFRLVAGSRSSIARNLFALCVLTASSQGFCQLTNATAKLTSIQTWLAGLAITIFTIVFMYVGYALAFGGKSFGEVWKILVGGFFVGGAAGLASFAAG
jgi:hypothetical protein